MSVYVRVCERETPGISPTRFHSPMSNQLNLKKNILISGIWLTRGSLGVWTQCT